MLLVVVIGFIIIGYGVYLKMSTNTTPSYMVNIVGTFLFIPGLLSIMVMAEAIANFWIKWKSKKKNK